MSTEIPQPPGVPLLGNIFDVDPNNTWVSLNKLAAKYGEIFKIKALGQQIVFICSAALLEEICDERRFRKCVTGPIVEIRHSVHDSLFTAYDHEASWGIAHRIMYPHLTTSSISSLVPAMASQASLLAQKWGNSHGNQRFDVTDGLRRLNIQCTTKCLFSQDIDCLDGPEPPVGVAMERATGEAVRRPTRPKLLNLLVYQRQFDKDTNTMRSFAADIVKKRREDPSQQGIKGDMLDVLLNGKDPETGKGLKESEIIDEIVSLFIGAVTGPNFLGFALYYLLKNTSSIAKAQEEIDVVLPKGEAFTHDKLKDLKYVEAILRESMRLSTPAPGFNIEPLPSTTQPVQLAGGKYVVPKNQVMITVLGAVNRDPSVFENPEAFQPERMLHGGFDKLPRGVKKGFGNGKRECIGKFYAWQWAMVTLTQILREADLKAADKDYTLKMDGAFSIKPVDFFALGQTRT